MHRRDYRDIATGSILALLGFGAALHAASNYALGTLNAMGPGMFPFGTGLLLGVLGLAVMAFGFMREGTTIHIDWHALLAVLAAIGAFGVVTIWFGLVPGSIATTLIAQFADNRLGIRRALMLGIGLAAASALLFVWALKLPLAIFHWPF